MTTSDDSSRWSDPERQIIDRAARDPAFRSRLLENPQAAVQEELGTSIPVNTTIRVVEEQPGEVILVLPARPVGAGGALTDEDLERAAGGLTAFGMTNCGTCSMQNTCAPLCG